jgi:hypothetical protein
MLTNFRKETSERSDASNWAKRSLIENTPYHFDSIEGCNENDSNVATHLMERARVDYDGNDANMDIDAIRIAILTLETEAVLQRKINFARAFLLNLTYVLYNDETQKVWMYEFESFESLKFVQKFDSFIAFSNWIAQIKGWKSTKPFRESQDLPLFDKVLRRAGTAWPTNIDCFVSDSNNNPVAILEFQNAKNTSVKDHCNNEFFLCKQEYTNPVTGVVKYHDDIRRWLSQEILRVQSGLRLFVVTWAQGTEDFILKEIEEITFPELPFAKDWNKTNRYKQDMHNYAVKKDAVSGSRIVRNYQSYSLEYEPPVMKSILHNPPLSAKDKTFPFIYYKCKWKIMSDGMELPRLFKNLIELDDVVL